MILIPASERLRLLPEPYREDAIKNERPRTIGTKYFTGAINFTELAENSKKWENLFEMFKNHESTLGNRL